MSTRLITFFVSLLLIATHEIPCAAGSSSQTATQIFELKPSSMTQILWRGNILIEKDTINYLSDDFKGKVTHDTKSGWQIINVTDDNAALQYRKEIATDGSRVEINVQMNLPAYRNIIAKPFIEYRFSVPLERLAGMNWTAITGRSHTPVEVAGKLANDTPDGPLAGESRWIAFTDNNRNIIFDLNPLGVTTYSDFGPGDVQGLWNIVKLGSYLQFSFAGYAAERGGTFTSKAIIFEGRHTDYLKHHAQRAYSYFSVLPCYRKFSFGADSPSAEFIAVDKNEFNSKTGYGWKSSAGLEVVLGNSKSVGTNAIASDRENSFCYQVDQPGLYVVTIRSPAYKTDAGPFSIICNGENKLREISIRKSTIKTITFSQWQNAGVSELKFGGNWTVSAIALQMLMHKDEDYVFNRGFWLADNVYEPTPVYSNSSYKKPVKYKVAVSDVDIPDKIIEPNKLPHMAKEVVLPRQDAAELAWRYNAFIGGLGVENTGTFLEYDTTEKIQQKLKTLKNMGVNTILIDGMIARHVHKEHLPRVQKTIKEIVRVGHELGMRMFDHQDLTMLWNKESAMRVMVEEIDWCQRTIKDNLVTRGRCLSNPVFRQQYFDWIRQFINNTMVDGIMIDEVAFHGENFCGCQHCRAQFTKDTGLIFPIDENSDCFHNPNSVLWKSWLEWRRKTTGDWWIEFRKQVQPDHPNFCIMGYTSEGGFQDKWGPLDQGSDLEEYARAIDFLGTEIMSRNVMDNCRYVFSSRKSYNVFREAYGSPVFGLVYPLESADFAYFGWAMNNMHGQATWSTVSQPNPEAGAKYIKWSENMDKVSAKPVCDIAMVFSNSSRDWGQDTEYCAELYGISQILTDNHIQHTIISESSLKLDKLKSYRVVILPNMSCISDHQVAQIKRYVEDGGRVLVTGKTGFADEIGQKRSKWAFADMFGQAEIMMNTNEYSNVVLRSDSNLPAEFSGKFAGFSLRKSDAGEIFLNCFDKNHKLLGPAGISRQFGNGRLFYCSPPLGAINYQTNFDTSSKFEFEMNIPCKEVLMDVFKNAFGDSQLAFKPVSIPQGVFITVYDQNVTGRQSRLVHFLNGTGVTIHKGDIVPTSKSKPAFPLLKNDVVFEIALPALTQCYAVSPDYSGHKPILTDKISPTRYRIIVPRECLESYTIVYLDQN